MKKPIPVYIDRIGRPHCELTATEQFNGLAFTNEALREFAEEISRQSYKWVFSMPVSMLATDEGILQTWFESPEFKKLLSKIIQL